MSSILKKVIIGSVAALALVIALSSAPSAKAWYGHGAFIGAGCCNRVYAPYGYGLGCGIYNSIYYPAYYGAYGGCGYWGGGCYGHGLWR